MTRRQLPLLLLTVAVAVVFGIVLCTAWNDEADGQSADDQCRDALGAVVEAVDSQWSTASEAVSRAQEAVQLPAVAGCLDGAQ